MTLEILVPGALAFDPHSLVLGEISLDLLAVLVRVSEGGIDLGQCEFHREEGADLLRALPFVLRQHDVHHPDAGVDAGGAATHPWILGDVSIGRLRRHGHDRSYSTIIGRAERSGASAPPGLRLP